MARVSELESTIDQRIRRRVEAFGGMYVKLEAASQRGWPDRFVGFPDGRHYMLEIKTNTGRLMPCQVSMIRKLGQCGVDVRIIRGERDANIFCAEVCGENPLDY